MRKLVVFASVLVLGGSLGVAALLARSPISFGGRTSYATGSRTWSVAIRSVSVLFDRRDGTNEPHKAYGTGGTPYAVMLAIPARASAAAAPGRLTPATLTTSGPVVAIAADGDRVGLIVNRPRVRGFSARCSFVSVWEVARKRLGRIPLEGPRRCQPDTGWPRRSAVAVAGTRIAWTEEQGVLTSYTEVVSATIARPRPVTLGQGIGTEGYGGIARNPAGDGRLLAFTVEEHCWYPDGGEPACPPGRKEGSVVSATVWRAAQSGSCPIPGAPLGHEGHCVRVAHAAGKLAVLAVDVGRIAVGTDHGVSLLSGGGGHLRDFRVRNVRAAALSRNLLALSLPGVIEVYDVHSGRIAARSPARSHARLDDLDAGILVTVMGRAVTLRRLGDRKTVTIHTRGRAHAQLEPAGLFVAAGHRVIFTPRHDVVGLLER